GAPPMITPTPGMPPVEQRSLTPPGYDGRGLGTSFGPGWQPLPPIAPTSPAPSVVRPTSPVAPPPPPVKLDRIAVGPDQPIEGTGARSESAPRPGARVQCVSADRPGIIQTVMCNTAGRFQVPLAPGQWLVYLSYGDGTQAFHSRIQVGDTTRRELTLTSFER